MFKQMLWVNYGLTIKKQLPLAHSVYEAAK